MKIAATVTILVALIIGSALPTLAYSEADFLRQSKFCENATRLPWGDVDQYAWDDCIALQGKLRSPEEYLKDMGHPNPEWLADLNAGSLWATEEGCLSWAGTQPENQPNHQLSDREVWTHNDAWNTCMQREGIFTPINRR